MEPDQYIKSQLNELKTVRELVMPKDKISKFIVSKITSKKFRKYAIDEAMRLHIEKVVENAVRSNEPINFVWVFGGYKLWRLPTAPEGDWAELFSMMYFAKWLKPIAEVYRPGVIFDFYSDDVIVSRLNNIVESDINAYQESFKKILKYFESYLPNNLKYTFHRVADQYGEGEFAKELEVNMAKLTSELPGGLPMLDDAKAAMVELNVKLNVGQDQDVKWKEKVLLLHDAYAMASQRRPYYRNEQKIMVLNTPVRGVIAIGTTKSSVAKFWCGLGVLEKRGEDYFEKILSPKQLAVTKIEMKKIKIDGLNGSNFRELGIVSSS